MEHLANPNPANFRPYVVVVDDDARDLRIPLRILERMNCCTAEYLDNLPAAMALLAEVQNGDKPAPKLLILDLDFQGDSGFELLRAWRTNPVDGMKIIVWTALHGTLPGLAHLFGVHLVVHKEDGESVLAEAIEEALGSDVA